ncbi:E3 ubiquitin-protein ligase [Armadillidium vulgare]|nr:E3 ubiquitin-protein ligase [Armadillidium vulgare]
MSVNEKIENVCTRILTKIKSELNSSPIELINTKELKEKVAQSICDKTEDNIVESLYPEFVIYALNNLSRCVLSDDYSVLEESQSNGEVSDPSLNLWNTEKSTNEGKRDFPINVAAYSQNKWNASIRETVDIIIDLLPNLNRITIEKKLRKHLEVGYKAKLLQECIAKTLEEGHEVSERVFEKLEEWLNSPVEIMEEKKLKVKNHKIRRKTTIDLTNLTTEKLPIECSTSNDKNNSRLTPFLKEYGNKDNGHIVCSSSITEKSSNCLDDPSLSELNLVLDSASNSSSFGNLQSSSLIIDQNFKSDDCKKDGTEPALIMLDGADSPASSESDVLVVEEVVPKHKINILETEIKSEQTNSGSFRIDDDDSPFQEDSVVDNLLTFEDLAKIAPTVLTKDIDSDRIPWVEAHSICKLLPFFELNNVHQSIMDNYYHPQRKVKVLTDYIELALDEGHDIPSDVFEILSLWQSNRKRQSPSSNCEFNFESKRLKPMIEEPQDSQSQPSTSTAATSDIAVQPLPPVKSIPNIPPEIQTLFESLPEETKLWYLKKVDFLYEITGFGKEYILSKILHCQTEADVMNVTTTLLEEQTMNIMQPDPQNYSSTEVLPEVSVAEAAVVASENEAQQGGTSSNSETNEENPSTSGNEDTGSATAADLEDRIQAHMQQLGEIFPDADPDYLSERANEIAGEQEKFVELVVEMTENRSYPKMEEYLQRKKKMNIRKKFIEGMSVEEFMEYFEDPEKVFCDTSKEMNKLYITNAREQLLNDLPFHLTKKIDSVFKSNNFHYLPTLRFLKVRKSKRKIGGKLPGDLDDIFLKEFCYVKMEKKIKEYYENKEKGKKLAFQKAKEAGELIECQCCFDDEVLFSEMSSCDKLEKPHFFCNTCIKRFAEEQIGQGKLEFICLEGECKSPFSLGTLKRLLKPSIFSNLLKRKQAEEIAAAGIDDLESCPFCNFATIMPNKEDKVFKCLNPECLKDSCRLCKELNHIPLRCQEVEKKKQTDARTFLENEMTEAMIRECFKCKKRFIKEEGCNKMVCSCGAMMCYLCKQPISGYNHFAPDNNRSSTTKNSQNKCPLWSNSLKLHAEEVQKRAAEAKQKLDPNVELVHDPTKDLPQE